MKKWLAMLLVVLFIAVIQPAEKANAITSYANANSIEVNREIVGTLSSSSSQHFYKFNVPTDGKVELRIKNLTNAAWEGKIVNSEGKEVDYVRTKYDSFANGYNSTFTGLSAGNYYVVISNYTGSYGKDYAFSVDYTPGNYFEKEQNDTLTTANPIVLNQTYQAALKDSSDRDFYKFTITEPGNIALTLKNVPGSSWEAAIYNSQENRYTSIYTPYNELVTGEAVANVGLPAGTYYIRINNYTGASDVVYNMTVKFTASELYEKEFNNSVLDANTFKLNNTFKGTLQNSGDIDYYKFTLTNDSNVTLSIPNKEGASWDMYLQDAEGKTLDRFYTAYSNILSKNSTINVGLPKGTYYVRISNYTGATNVGYSLKIDAKKSNLYEKEHNDSFTTATTLPINTAMNGTLSNKNYGDVDYYKLVNPTSGNVRFSLTQKSGHAWYFVIYDREGKKIYDTYTNYNELVKGDLTYTSYLPKGTYYVKISNYTSSTWKPYTLKVSQTTVTPSAKNIIVKNNKGKSDTITVKGIKAGSIVKVYNAKSKQIASVTAKNTTVTLSVKQLGKAAGKIYVTVQEPGKIVSAKRTVNYSKEK